VGFFDSRLPKSRADLTGLTTALYRVTLFRGPWLNHRAVNWQNRAEHGSWCCLRLVAHHTASVLSQFSDSWFDSIQLATAPTHSEIFDDLDVSGCQTW